MHDKKTKTERNLKKNLIHEILIVNQTKPRRTELLTVQVGRMSVGGPQAVKAVKPVGHIECHPSWRPLNHAGAVNFDLWVFMGKQLPNNSAIVHFHP